MIIATDKLYRTIANDRPYIEAFVTSRAVSQPIYRDKEASDEIYTTMKTFILLTIVVLVSFLDAASVHKLVTYKYTNCSKFIHQCFIYLSLQVKRVMPAVHR